LFIYLKTLRILLSEAWRDGHGIENVANKVKTLKVRENRTARRPFTTAQIETLLAHASGEWKGMILFGFYTASSSQRKVGPDRSRTNSTIF
jgi:hypothetical protein